MNEATKELIDEGRNLLKSEITSLLTSMQESHEQTVTRILNVVEGQRSELDKLHAAFNALRDKAQALAIIVGDLQDEPVGSLRQRVSSLEDRIGRWAVARDEIKKHFPEGK